ncbi:MAG TPA: N-6 DNA methylase [Planctomycetota bacterium]|nr:N-6 DNA methylase [Planctomycetota bacterium]
MSASKQQARQALATLLQEFGRLDTEHGFAGQAEATARTWIERFLTIFGWDPADPNQVVQEFRILGREARRLKREGTTHRRPDYALFIAGQRIAYLDAKRFDVELSTNANAAFQVRSYGWSAGLRVSYAFDFRELAIYDCRVVPDQDDEASVARVHYITIDQYLDRFDLLWDYFGRSAIADGSIARRHPDDERPRGSLPLDEAFEMALSDWRKQLATTILRQGKVRDPQLLSAAAQRILDRIVFIRLCEEIGLEEQGTLNALLNDEDGFWSAFMREHVDRWSHVYDGILFPSSDETDPTGVERHLRSWWLKGTVFKSIVGELYYPKPYRFDVVPLELLGGIYEKYLGKRLHVVGNTVEDEYKPEHQRTKGAVYTPPWIVRRVLQRTLAPLLRERTPEDVLGLRIVDPACGSGSFLLGTYDLLEAGILNWCRAHPDDPQTKRHCIMARDGARLARSTARTIIETCLHGVDIDPEAVEVARMSLALRFVERTAQDEPGEPSNLLHGIGRNIRHGNSIVGMDFIGLGLAPAAVDRVMPFDWSAPTQGFPEVMAQGGFDAVVGNPPYIEVKRFKEWLPEMYTYIKKTNTYATAAQGKTDIAMPFMERGLSLLRPGGRLGFIVQNRFFKTDYGELTRRWLRTNRLLEDIEDFRDLQVFPRRTTYTAILVLARDSQEFGYRTYLDRATAEAGAPSLQDSIRIADIDDGVWSFDQPDLMRVHAELVARHGTIADHKRLQISVGLQTLWGKLYQLEPIEVRERTVQLKSALASETVTLERGALRPLCCNRSFYPFRRDNADAFVIFPYDLEDDGPREIGWKNFKKRYPKAARYLEEHRRELKDAVQVPEGADRWHLYTRPQNLEAQAHPKVLFPSTIEDTIASVDGEGDVYQDNVRVNSLSVSGNTVDLLAICAVFNSSTFSALARLKAGLSDSGWRGFNRQYAELVPLPLGALKDKKVSSDLSTLARKIQATQEQLLGASAEGAKGALSASLVRLWGQLDDVVNAAYGLTDRQLSVVARYPRRIDRVELLHRQAEAFPIDDAATEDDG